VTTAAGLGAGALITQQSLLFAGTSRTDSLGMQHWCVGEIVPAKHNAVGASSNSTIVAAITPRIERRRTMCCSKHTSPAHPVCDLHHIQVSEKRAPPFAN
jgi:hypothetical protein